MDQGTSLKNIEAGSNGRVTHVKLEDGSSIEADTVSWCSYILHILDIRMLIYLFNLGVTLHHTS